MSRLVMEYKKALSAVQRGDVEALLKVLLDSPASAEFHTSTGMNIVLVAAKHGHSNIIRALMKFRGNDWRQRDTDIEARAANGMNPLMAALKMGHGSECVRALLEYGDPTTLEKRLDARDHKHLTALMIAVDVGNVSGAETLLQYFASAQLEARGGRHGSTALMMASLLGRTDCVRMIMKQAEREGLMTVREHLRARNDQGCTAFVLAVEGGHCDCILELITCYGRKYAIMQTNSLFTKIHSILAHQEKSSRVHSILWSITERNDDMISTILRYCRSNQEIAHINDDELDLGIAREIILQLLTRKFKLPIEYDDFIEAIIWDLDNMSWMTLSEQLFILTRCPKAELLSRILKSQGRVVDIVCASDSAPFDSLLEILGSIKDAPNYEDRNRAFRSLLLRMAARWTSESVRNSNIDEYRLGIACIAKMLAWKPSLARLDDTCRSVLEFAVWEMASMAIRMKDDACDRLNNAIVMLL